MFQTLNLDDLSDITQISCLDFDKSSISNIILPKNIQVIPEYCLSGFSNLRTVYRQSKILKIEKGAFKECYNLLSLYLSSVQYIGQDAFSGCSSLYCVKGLANCLSIMDNSFQNCISLSSINLKNVEYIANNAFSKFRNNQKKETNFRKKLRNFYIDNLKVALCVIARNENSYIREFIEYYKNLGIDKIFLYDTNPYGSEDFHDVIGDYIDSNYIECIKYNIGHQITQEVLDAYNDCYTQYSSEYDWICFFDPDEYLTFNFKSNIKDFLCDSVFNNFDVIHINWMTYDDNNLLSNDYRNLNERFTHPCADMYNLFENERVKSIVRGNLAGLIFTTPHTPEIISNQLQVCNNIGKEVPNTFKNEINFDNAYLKHFRCKTITEYCENKLPKLTLAGYQNLVFDDSFFFSLNRWAKEKQEIFDRYYGRYLLKDYNLEYRRRYKYSVITVLTGNNPNAVLYEPKYTDSDVEYICITDRTDLKSYKWRIITLKLDFDGQIGRWKYPKFHPFEFAHSDICFYIDSTIQIQRDIGTLIDVFSKGGYDIGFMPHPERCNVIDELNRWVEVRGYPRETAERLRMFYKEQNFNSKTLFFCSAIIFRNTERTENFLDSVWEMLLRYGENGDASRSDQIMIPYCLYSEYGKIKPNSVNIEDFLSQWIFLFSPKTICSIYMLRKPIGADKYWSAPRNTSYLCFDRIVKPFEL